MDVERAKEQPHHVRSGYSFLILNRRMLAGANFAPEHGQFDERRLVLSQMREALTALNRRFGCRLFAVALGDPKRPYDGGKVGP